MNTFSRVREIFPPAGDRPRRAYRIGVRYDDGADFPRVVLAPGDEIVVVNRCGRRLHVAPLDFFGNAFGRYALEPGESTPSLTVQGLWFQVEMHVEGRVFYPLDVYMAANAVV